MSIIINGKKDILMLAAYRCLDNDNKQRIWRFMFKEINKTCGAEIKTTPIPANDNGNRPDFKNLK